MTYSKHAQAVCTSVIAMAAAFAANTAMAQSAGHTETAWEASRRTDESDMVTTGVAKGRDRLDSATSTSSIKENEIVKLAPRSMADLFRNIPGIRVEAAAGEGSNDYTVRGLPLVGEGAKYLQIQEDGLPVMEFGDINGNEPDNFTRIDLNIGQVESIRGGSSSTFASNAPGGVINLISKTGEVEGGSIQTTAGLDYGTARVDGDYGGHLGNGWRFHVGGFYRRGEGARKTGFAAYRGGQVKFNVTKQFASGFVRFYGKYLDDRYPVYRQYPAAISGTNDNADITDLPGFSLNHDSLLSRYIPENLTVMPDDSVNRGQNRDGKHSRVKSGGLEAQFKLAGWSIAERFRYANMSSSEEMAFPVLVATPAQLAAAFQIPGATFTYASGPHRGEVFDGTRGNGLLAVMFNTHIAAPNLSDLTNDLRASRVWRVGGGDLTTTVGLYKARQNDDRTYAISTVLQDVVGGGNASLINLAAAGGLFPISQGGTFLYSAMGNPSVTSQAQVRYAITAPYGSFNFHTGRIAIGGSVRYDTGHVKGKFQRAAMTLRCVDVNGDGITIPGTAECSAISYDASGPTPVNYRYHYVSYSAGVNFRVAAPLALFARYSKGSRAGAEAVLTAPVFNTATGGLLDPKVARDPVKQAEAGLKYRNAGITFNVTGFYATTNETNSQINQDSSGNARLQIVQRSYRAYGAEFEGGVRHGPFSLQAGATLAHAEISAAETPSLKGNTPRHQPKLIYQVTPQYDTDLFTFGANVVGVTSSYAQDTNQLRLPGYTTVGLFAQVRPVERLELSVNASNVFDTRAVTETLDATFPASNVVLARTLYGRMISASARFFF